jgi:hypothetical protein
VKLVTTFLPIRSSGFARPPLAGTWTCRAHLPKSRSRTSSTPMVAVGGTTHSCSATWSRPVMPRSTRPSPTNVGMSAAGRKTSASGRFLTSAMSSREWRWTWMSEPWRRSRQAWWRRPSVAIVSRYRICRGCILYSWVRQIATGRSGCIPGCQSSLEDFYCLDVV